MNNAANVPIHIKLFHYQSKIVNSGIRFQFVRGGTRVGKTYTSACWLLRRAGMIPNSINWYMSITSAQARDVVWPLLKSIIPREMMRKEPSEVYKEIYLVNGSIIACKSAEQTDNLRGSGIDSLVCDEIAFWPDPGLFDTVLRMRLADRNGFALFISSPNGSNAFRKKENEFLHLIKNGSKEHAVYHLTTWDNPRIPRSELEELKRTLPEAKYRQEVMAEYVDEQGLVYFEFTDQQLIKTQEPPARIMCGLDWGLDDNAAAAWVNIHVDGTLHLSREYVVNNTAPQDTAARIKQLTPTIPNAYVMDSSCWRREGTSMTSIADVYAKAGIRAFQATRSLDVSIGYVKRALSTGLLTIDPSCVNAISALQEWQHGQHEPDILAALRYAIAYIFEFNLSPMASALKVAVSDAHFKAQLDSTRNSLAPQPNHTTSVMLKPGVTQEMYDRQRYGVKRNRLVWGGEGKWKQR